MMRTGGAAVLRPYGKRRTDPPFAKRAKGRAPNDVEDGGVKLLRAEEEPYLQPRHVGHPRTA